MPDDVLRNAEALRNSIAKRVAGLRADLTAAEADLQQAESMVERAKGNRNVAVSSPAARNPSRQDVMDVVREVLAEVGKPLKLQPLHERIAAKGIALSGRDPAGVLSTMLWRGGQDGTLVNIKGAGYWDASKPYAPAKYQPSAK